jgi:hypothetical protein
LVPGTPGLTFRLRLGSGPNDGLKRVQVFQLVRGSCARRVHREIKKNLITASVSKRSEVAQGHLHWRTFTTRFPRAGRDKRALTSRRWKSVTPSARTPRCSADPTKNEKLLQCGLVALPRYQTARSCRPDDDFCDFARSMCCQDVPAVAVC